MQSKNDKSEDETLYDRADKSNAPEACESGSDAVGEEADADDEGSGDSASAGESLRAARERGRLSLEHIAAQTRIPIRHLETIEAGEFDDLPSRTYAIGFARSYARSVGLDETVIADQVREEMGDSGPRYSSVGQGMEPGDPAKLPSRGLAWFGGLAAVILALGVITYASTYYGTGESLASMLPETQSEGDAGAVPNAEASAGVVSEEQSAAAVAAPDAGGPVVFTATGEGAWVRFYEEDGERLFEGVMRAGDTFEVPTDATAPFINTGRPNLFAITINGQQVAPLSEEMVPIQAPVSATALLERDASAAQQ